MKKAIGFDNEKYLEEQSRAILERASQSGDKLYLEFGGKLLFDYHAARVLPGFDPNVKIRLLKKLASQAEILLCIYAGDIERRKVRADFGITYDSDALKLIDDLRTWGLAVAAVVITRYEKQPAATVFKNRLERQGVRVFTHQKTRGYPADVDLIVSQEGYGANPYVSTNKSLVVVTGPGPNSGKLATCLSQLYHEYRMGNAAGYAKFETFPVWNLPLEHPVNVAYEAATADLKDENVMDPFHHEAYGSKAVNYNRDVDAFPLVARILHKITGKASIYKSPTDMGVNRVGFAVVDNQLVCQAARQEVIRRKFRYACEYTMGLVSKLTVERIEFLMDRLGINTEERKVVLHARSAARAAQEAGKGHDGICCGAAIELDDGSIITGVNSDLLHASSSLVLNAIKHLAEIPDNIHLLSPNVMESIAVLKKNILNMRAVSLTLEETLSALGISAATNPTAHAAMEKLVPLRNCEIHLTHIPTPGDEAGLRRLGVNVTSDPQSPTKSLYTA